MTNDGRVPVTEETPRSSAIRYFGLEGTLIATDDVKEIEYLTESGWLEATDSDYCLQVIDPLEAQAKAYMKLLQDTDILCVRLVDGSLSVDQCAAALELRKKWRKMLGASPGAENRSLPEANAALAAENKLLRAQLQAQSDRADFIEDCIAEMAMLVYV